MNQIKEKINDLRARIGLLKFSLGRLSPREADYKIMEIKNEISDLLREIDDRHKKSDEEFKKLREEVDEIIIMINDIKRISDSFEKTGIIKKFSEIAMIILGLLPVGSLLGSIALYLYLHQHGVEQFFYETSINSNNFIFIISIGFIIGFFHILHPYFFLHLELSNNEIQNNIKFLKTKKILHIITIATCGFIFSFSGYYIIFPMNFSLLAALVWIVFVFVIRKLFIRAHQLRNHDSKKFKLPLFMSIWLLSFVISYGFSSLSSINNDYDFGRLFSQFGFTQNYPSWQKLSNEYKQHTGLNDNEIFLLKEDFKDNKSNIYRDLTDAVYLYGELVVNAKDIKIFCAYSEVKTKRRTCREFPANALTDISSWIVEDKTPPASSE